MPRYKNKNAGSIKCKDNNREELKWRLNYKNNREIEKYNKCNKKDYRNNKIEDKKN